MNTRLNIFCLLFLLVIAGCGGGGSSNNSPDPTPPSLGTRPSNTTCLAALRPSIGSLTLTNAFPNLTLATERLTGLKQSPNNNFWYVANRAGRILRFASETNVSSTTEVLDISDRVALNLERGLLGFAFSPNFANDGAIYVSYTTANRSRISRFISTDSGQSFPSTTGDEHIIFEHIQLADNHNGGDLHFGPDGYLYLSLGDDNNRALAQDLSDVRGSILRINPNSNDNLPSDSTLTIREYAIPADNPFANNSNARPEIYAYGFRNPWRFTIDHQTGDIWVGDVGETAREEIDQVTAGGNYGWPHKEGTQCRDSNPCDNNAWIDPVIEYGRSEGISVIAGHVYRGTTIPELIGKLIFSEWSSGVVWALSIDPQTGESTRVVVGNVGGFQVVSWGQSNDGEIFAAKDAVPVIVEGSGSPGQSFPQKLSDTGCVQTGNPTQKMPGLIPYDVNIPLWSDNAIKHRWLAIPDDRFISISANGHWDVPIGSVLVKDFVVDGVLAETRLLMRHNDGGWAGYAYKWNDQGTNADLVLNGSSFATGSRNWAIPSAAQCLQCHTEAARQTLGMQTVQMNRTYDYPGVGEVNQLAAFNQLNLLTHNPGDPSILPALSPLNDSASDEKHARDYLHVQCAHCHQPGSVNTAIDLRWNTSFANTNLCNTPPIFGDLGVPGANLLTPGSATQSIVALRMHTRDNNQMPKLGTVLVDTQATAIIDAWINALQNCP